ncbi:hypothetical protein BDZ45DRAFT_671114 [Acephala macrosclerotiorum]|nr:hypothetical protein BDZ45DRAFT_671114 [Acephala macrosclerotiorum]
MPSFKAAALGCGLPQFFSKKPSMDLPVEPEIQVKQTITIEYETVDTVKTVHQVETMVQTQVKSTVEVIGTSGGGPYAQTWGRDRRAMGRKVYVNGVEVTADPMEPFPSRPATQPNSHPTVEFITQRNTLPIAEAAAQPAAERTSKFRKVKHQLRESAQIFNSVFDKAQGKFTFKRGSTKHTQTPGGRKKKRAENGLLSTKNGAAMDAGQISINGGLDLAVPFVNNFKVAISTISLRELGQFIQRKFSREPKVINDMTPLPEQRPAVPDMEALLTTRQVEGIEAWAAATSTVVNFALVDCNFQVLTTSELLKLGGSRIDNIEVVKQYIGPPNSPDLHPTDKSMPALELPELNLDDIDSLDDDFLFDITSKAKRKDLLNYLGHSRNASFHLVAPGPSSYDADINISDWYSVPLVEQRTIHKVVAMPIDEPVVETSENGDDKDNKAVNRKSAYSMCLSENSWIYDPEDNILLAAPSYPPAQSLALYLHGQGMRLANICDMLGQLDEEFLAEKKSMVFNGVQFPERLDWSDDWVEKVGTVCRAKMKTHKYQLILTGMDTKMHGRSHRLNKKASKEKKMRSFVEKVIENHLFWRLNLGERLHCDLF